MTIAEFLTNLQTLDIKLWTDGDNLRFSAPKGALTTELKKQIQEKKPEILAFLQLARHIKPLKHVERDLPIPLSYGQQRLWFVQQLQPDSPAYNIPRSIHIQGALQVTALEQAFQTLITRHESLRTTFNFVDGNLSQLIAPPETGATFSLTPIICTEAEAREQIATSAWQPFDLAVGPLIRVQLFQFDSTDYLLFINLHHIIFDGWSFNIFNTELTLCYEMACRQESPQLSPQTFDYADFTMWEQEYVAETQAKHLAYWTTQLSGELPNLQLPTDYARPTIQQFSGKTTNFNISSDLTTELEKVANHYQCTLFMVMMTAFTVLLHRYSGQDDILVGYPYANREYPSGVQMMVGFFINTLVLRTDLANNPTLFDLLVQVRERVLMAENHHALPFNKVVSALQPTPDLSRQPIFQVMFSWQNLPDMTLTLPDVEVSSVEIENKISKFDLTLEILPHQQGLIGRWEYNRDLFKEQTIQQMAVHFDNLLWGMVSQPNSPIATIPILSEAEQYQQLVQWNDTESAYARDYTFGQWFTEQALHQTEATALIWFSNIQTDPLALTSKTKPVRHDMSYQTLFEQANQVAHYLQQQGIGPDSLVAICAQRTPDMIVGLLGVLQAGAAYLPLDPSYPEERLAFMLADSQATILLTQEALLPLSRSITASSEDEAGSTITVTCLDRDWPTIAMNPTTPPDNQSTPDNLAYIIYTSGSTGHPKGVMVRQGGLMNYLHWAVMTYPYTEGCGTPLHSSISFDLTITSLFGPLYIGEPVILIPEEDKFGNMLSQLPQEFGPFSVVKITPAHLGLLEQQLSPEQAAEWAKGIVIGGEALWRDNVAFWQTHAPDTLIVNEYGPTETVVGCCIYVVPPEPLEQVSVPIGRPIANTELYILDEHYQLVPRGVSGQLFIGGEGVARGYLHRPDLTELSFIPNPFGEGRLYRTGDLARYLADGNLEFLGRLDHQVKVRGYRIELGEIETLLTQHSAVKQAVVITRNQRLLAYVVAEPKIPTQQLHDYLSAKLPEYMVPSHFILLNVLPLTPNGKVNRDVLPVPQTERSDLSVLYVPPRNSMERFLAQMWADILGLDEVGIHDDFFELGGHSLQVAQIVFKIKQLFSVELTMRDFFAQVTVARITKIIQTYRKESNQANIETTDMVTDWLADTVLPDDIQPSQPFTSLPKPLETVFLTGGSGYLGAFLLRELLMKTEATIYCLVRAENTEAGMQRLKENLIQYQLWNEAWSERIKPIVGHLDQPRFGLDSAEYAKLAQISQQIYHAGAAVNLVYPYQQLRQTNVIGTLEILRFATHARTIPVHHISTLAVFASTAYFQGGTINEDDPLLAHEGHFNGYGQSKWVADRLMLAARERGIPVSIYRPGVIGGDSQTGAAHHGDYFFKYLKGCIQLGAMPDLGGRWYITPIDFVSQAVVALSLQPTALGQTFHVMTDHFYTTAQLINLLKELGYSVKGVSDFATWQQLLVDYIRQNDDHMLYPLLPLYVEGVTTAESATLAEMYSADREPTYTRHNLVRNLSPSLTCPVVDKALLGQYFQFFIDQGFMPSP